MLERLFTYLKVRQSFIYLILLLLFTLNNRADILDSINKQLQKTQDSLKIDRILSSANELMNINNDSSLHYANAALALAKQQNNPHKKISAIILIGKALYTKGDYNSAIEEIEKAYQESVSLNDSIHLIDVYQVYSLIYSKLGDFKKALDYSQQAFTLVGKLNQQDKLADLVRETGNIYFSFGESTIALDFYQKSLALCKDKNDDEGMSKALNNIGRIYSESKQFNKALVYLNQSLEIKSKHDNKLGIANTLLNIGTIYLQQENYNAALGYFKGANENYWKVSYNEGIANSYQFIARTYSKQGRYQEAEESFNKALMIAEKNSLKPILFNITLGQSELYASMKDYKRAYMKFLDYKLIRDSIYSNERRNLLMELDAKYRLQSKERQIQFLSKEQELQDAQQKKLIFWNALLIVAALLLISITYMVYSRMRFKNKLNRQLIEEINQRKQIELELQRHKEHLEALVEDRTKDLKIAKDKAEESDMLKTAFLANMSHEIRTPMNAIVGFTNLLLDPELNESERIEYIQLINSNSDSLLNLINDIIDLSTIEAGQIRIINSNICLFDTLEELHSIFNQEQNKFKKQSIELRLEYNLSDPLISLCTDKNRFKQVFSNLLSNAFKFTNSGSISFGVRESKSDSYLFFVKDTGIGIPDCNRESIFDRFSKFTNDDDNKIYSGTGLGLALSKEIVELLGGRIWFDSVVGVGSTFYFTLPKSLTVKQPYPREVKIEEGLSYKFQNKTVIIAEDVTSNYKLLQAYLSKTGINIIWAKTGVEVIEKLSSNPVDLVLMDIQMPILDGIRTTSKIRGSGYKVPIVIQTAFALTEDIEKCFEAGCNDFLVKPIRKEELLDKLSIFLE